MNKEIRGQRSEVSRASLLWNRLAPGLWPLASLLLLISCGFQPLHSKEYRSELQSGLSSVAVIVDTSRRGQLLEAEIIHGINPTFEPAEKHYTLSIALNEREIPLFINPDGTSSRGDIEYVSRYTLSRKADGVKLQEGVIRRVSSYNTSESADYASYVSIEDARTRGIVELAEAYKLRIANLLPALSGRVPLPDSTSPTPHLPDELNLPSRLKATQ